MPSRPARITIADFVLRFAALLALTVAVLTGVAVRARDQAPAGAQKETSVATRETATDINSRRYPLVHADPRLPR
jgi:NAD/NADP transhydrogenase alpha subunit